MFGDLALLFNEVSKVHINISYKVKIGILILVLMSLALNQASWYIGCNCFITGTMNRQSFSNPVSIVVELPRSSYCFLVIVISL